MSSFDAVTYSAYSDERGMQFLATELKLEISSYLGIHDQLAMRKVCKLWKSYLCMSQRFLSRYVDIDVSKMPEPPGSQQADRDGQRSGNQKERISLEVSRSILEHALRMYVEKNTKVLVIRHMDCNYWKCDDIDGSNNGNTFDMVGRVLDAKGADLFQLVFKDCEMPEQCGGHNWWWTNPQRMVGVMLRGLVSATRKFTLDTYTIRNAFGGIAPVPDIMTFYHMPCCYRVEARMAARNMYKKLPIVLPHHEFDCTKPFHVLFRSFMMAINAHCPPVSSVVRHNIVQLCSFWRTCGASQHQWLLLRQLIQCYNEGIYIPRMLVKNSDHVTVDKRHITALRQLDPLSLNKLTTEVLHRMYCLPRHGAVYPPPARCPYKG